ncbi:AF1514 family protein [Archaeoglobus neptunius]|uniref:AF1514 family protein n=1 Tax=Archaeoglobus neptunius TaxID=2798580 RepID=UPI001E648B0F|nr:AF1514 family protein [Archaeoglobus neptunius]
MKEVKLKLDGEVTLDKAEKYARKIAEKYGENILLSLCNLKTGYRSPEVYCCGEKPWEVYARSRGANLKVVINEFEFFFNVENFENRA